MKDFISCTNWPNINNDISVVCVVADWPSVWCAVVFCVHQISEEYWCSGLNMDRGAGLDPHYSACKEIVKPPSQCLQESGN